MFKLIRTLKIKKLEKEISDLNTYIKICSEKKEVLLKEKRQLIKDNLREAYIS